MKAETQTDWSLRVDRVISLITGAADESAGLDAAAAEAASSPWHFHRRFKTMTGESFAACLKRLRLERAAFRLKGGISVIDAALEAGFESPEAFCRVFTARFGLNPSKVGRLPWWKGELPAPNGLHWRPDRPRVWFTPGEGFSGNTTRLVELPPQRLAGLRGQGDPWQLPELWERFTELLYRNRQLPRSGDMLTVFEPGGTFCVGFLQKEGDDGIPVLTTELIRSELPGGLYAVTAFFGPCEGIGPFWDHWGDQFFKSSGWKKDGSRPSLEWYQNRPPSGLPELGLTLICDPVC
jgi:AraC-like DNA-binding protein/DNA gyrase inhibitor GyrI